MTRSLHTLIQYLRQHTPRCGEAALTDAQLLERWISQRDAAAFELLLWRHGLMVLNTCRRLLRRREDVEDAFQATFLVLLRKAGSIRRREAVAAWLHRVACRIAGRARAEDIRRASREQPLATEPIAPHIEMTALRDLHAIVDEEIERLPAHYRRALILCCLEGKSQEEAARLLSCPRGTVSSWLTRGRDRLRRRLLRRGIVVSTAALTAVLTPDALAAGGMVSRIGLLMRLAGGAVANDLMSARTIALAEGVLRMMFMTKVKIVAAVSLAVVLMAVGVGMLSHPTRAGDPAVLLQGTPESPKINPHQRRLLSNDKAPLEQDRIAWGEAAHGLQAGIAYRRGDQETYEVGQSVTFVIYLRNVSDKAIRLSHIEPLLEEGMPVVRDADGRHLAVASGPINFGVVPILQRSVEAGQRIALGYPWFRIRPLGWRGDIIGPTCCAAPGRYQVGYTSLVLRLNDGKDISLSTKQVELHIRKPETVSEDRPQARAANETRQPVTRRTGIENSSPSPFYISSRTVCIPVRAYTKNREQTAELILLASDNQGESYKQVSRIHPDAKQFIFNAPHDGMYWFIVQVVDRQGRCVPRDPFRTKPSMRVCVDTELPVIELQVASDQKMVHLAWAVKDANLEEKPVRMLEWSEERNGPWSPIAAGPFPKTGHFTWNVPDKTPSDCYLRVSARDKAGNDEHGVVYVKLK